MGCTKRASFFNVHALCGPWAAANAPTGVPALRNRIGPDRVHCTATSTCSLARALLLQVSPDFTDLWVAQAAWFTYSAMLRVFKHYDFALAHPGGHSSNA